MRSKIKIFGISVLMIVLFCIAYYVIPNRFGHVDSKEELANFQIESLVSILEEYYSEHRRYPSSLEELSKWFEQKHPEDNRNLAGLLIDPWNAPYHYSVIGSYNKESYDLWTYGADNLLGGEGKNTDIYNKGKLESRLEK